MAGLIHHIYAVSMVFCSLPEMGISSHSTKNGRLEFQRRIEDLLRQLTSQTM